MLTQLTAEKYLSLTMQLTTALPMPVTAVLLWESITWYESVWTAIRWYSVMWNKGKSGHGTRV